MKGNLLYQIKVLVFLLIGITGIVSTSFKPAAKLPGAQAINWMNWDMAVKLNKEHPKKIFVDIYTQWCGWCKKMDWSTYQDKGIIDYINKNFYAVRLDAETRDTFHFDNHIFVNSNPGQQGSVNELAYSLMDGKMVYPTTIYLDEKFDRLSYLSGYLSTQDLKMILTFFAEDKYKTMTYEDYKKRLGTAAGN
ncbi:MAG: thioredoxin family protein [Bacteroidia bacterium]